MRAKLAAVAPIFIFVPSGSACTARSDAATADAWQRAVEQQSAATGTAPENGAGNGAGRPLPLVAESEWTRIGAVVERASSVFMVTSGPEAIARLASDWCAVEPVPIETDHGPVRLCHPAPPIAVDGHAFSLELGATGVIGLVAADLTAAESEQLSQQARSALTPWCSSPFEVEQEDLAATPELHICPMRGGSTLVVGRLRADDEEPWQVSISVLGASS